jgi:hypothetical protein
VVRTPMWGAYATQPLTLELVVSYRRGAPSAARMSAPCCRGETHSSTCERRMGSITRSSSTATGTSRTPTSAAMLLTSCMLISTCRRRLSASAHTATHQAVVQLRADLYSGYTSETLACPRTRRATGSGVPCSSSAAFSPPCCMTLRITCSGSLSDRDELPSSVPSRLTCALRSSLFQLWKAPAVRLRRTSSRSFQSSLRLNFHTLVVLRHV